jgi:membrane protein implicated in regulation of membrane protease activity
MAESTLWWLLAGGLVALELLTGTFYLLMLALGAAAGALAAHLGWGVAAQLVAAASLGGGAVVCWYRWQARSRRGHPDTANRDVNLDIGETVHIDLWAADATAQVKYRGASWTAVLLPDHVQTAAAGPHRIQEVIGNRLMVAPIR